MTNKITGKITEIHKITPEGGNAELVLQKYERKHYKPVYKVAIKTDDIEILETFKNEDEAHVYFWEKEDGFLKDYDGWMY